MKAIASAFREGAREEDGQTVVEYSILVVLICIPAVLALAAIVGPIATALEAAADLLV